MSNFYRYSIVGATSLAIDNIIIFLLGSIYGYIIARSISYLITNIVVFFIHSLWTFKLNKVSFLNFIKFIFFNSSSVFLSYLLSIYINYFIFNDNWQLLSTNISASIFFLINYLINKKFIFKPK